MVCSRFMTLRKTVRMSSFELPESLAASFLVAVKARKTSMACAYREALAAWIKVNHGETLLSSPAVSDHGEKPSLFVPRENQGRVLLCSQTGPAAQPEAMVKTPAPPVDIDKEREKREELVQRQAAYQFGRGNPPVPDGCCWPEHESHPRPWELMGRTSVLPDYWTPDQECRQRMAAESKAAYERWLTAGKPAPDGLVESKPVPDSLEEQKPVPSISGDGKHLDGAGQVSAVANSTDGEEFC